MINICDEVLMAIGARPFNTTDSTHRITHVLVCDGKEYRCIIEIMYLYKYNSIEIWPCAYDRVCMIINLNDPNLISKTREFIIQYCTIPY